MMAALDYNTDVLQNFDLVIASVHLNLKMKEDKAMGLAAQSHRKSIYNILGHPTGRLLLSRNGYPIDHKQSSMRVRRTMLLSS